MHETETIERIKRERCDAEAEDADLSGRCDRGLPMQYMTLGTGRLGEIRRALLLYRWHMLGTCFYLLYKMYTSILSSYIICRPSACRTTS